MQSKYLCKVMRDIYKYISNLRMNIITLLYITILEFLQPANQILISRPHRFFLWIDINICFFYGLAFLFGIRPGINLCGLNGYVSQNIADIYQIYSGLKQMHSF